jgi:hypothetical protein
MSTRQPFDALSRGTRPVLMDTLYAGGIFVLEPTPRMRDCVGSRAHGRIRHNLEANEDLPGSCYQVKPGPAAYSLDHSMEMKTTKKSLVTP